jgi:hypothetical protein
MRVAVIGANYSVRFGWDAGATLLAQPGLPVHAVDEGAAARNGHGASLPRR